MIHKVKTTVWLLHHARRLLPSGKSSRERILLCDPIFHPEKAFSFCALFSILRLCGELQAQPLFLYEKRKNIKELGWYRLLAGIHTTSVEDILRGIPPDESRQPSSLAAVYNYKIRSLPIGRCLWDECIWNKKSTLRTPGEAKTEIGRAQAYFQATTRLLLQKNIVAGFFTHTTGVMSGVPLRILLRGGIPVYSSYGNLKAYKKYDYLNPKTGYLPPATAVSRDRLDTAMKIPGLLKKAKQFKEKTFPLSPGNPKKPRWLVAMHAFSDTPNGSLQYIFKDYAEWIHFTIRQLKKNRKVEWVIKTHPHRGHWPDDFDYAALKETIRNEPHISFWEEAWDVYKKPIGFNREFGQFGGVLSCGGTMAIQFYASGRAAVVCADNFFQELNLLPTGKSRAVYARLIQSISPSTPRPSKVKARKALLAYFLAYRHLPSLLVPENFSNWAAYTAEDYLRYLAKFRKARSDLIFL